MSAQALALVLLAGLVHAGWNVVAKQSGGDARFAFFTSVLMALAWAPLGLWLGWGKTATLSASTILKNQPWAMQTTTAAATVCT